ncbi:MAG: hypothetical protein ACREMN_01690 [Gemmatimonadales bacterium]
MLAAAGLGAARLAGQEFVPPKTPAGRGGTRIGLYGFGVRGGLDFRGAGQIVLGTTLDLGDLFTSRVRLRPSGEIGLFNGPNTYVGNFEALWRFTHDDEAAIPYLGLGVGLAGHEDCGADPGCPGVWVNVVFGFELHYRSTFNWLIEYHGMDTLRRHRVYIGLTTRRGN